MPEKIIDIDPQETQEWLEALDSVLAQEGIGRAHYLLEQLIAKARKSGAYLPYSANTAYLNTIPPSREERAPGDPGMEWRIRSLIRWNALAMVVRGQSFQRRTWGDISPVSLPQQHSMTWVSTIFFAPPRSSMTAIWY